ncbi:hypothetical protein BGZ65_001443 [Modicella reniformis]|uniref:Uncharacterized protein n=1 Tax=Modicella reniformis TaxID=1440133 RepID=A0A9P6LT20_9FUNG|nr:hypothetical protein BGZ65_001443 [Modicella reniformis]
MDNRARLDTAGIDLDVLFMAQFVVDGHQKRPMEKLLRDTASMDEHPNITGDLKGIVLENEISKPTKTKKLIIHIVPEPFETPERATGARFISIKNLFNNLGTGLQDQSSRGNSTNGEILCLWDTMLPGSPNELPVSHGTSTTRCYCGHGTNCKQSADID